MDEQEIAYLIRYTRKRMGSNSEEDDIGNERLKRKKSQSIGRR